MAKVNIGRIAPVMKGEWIVSYDYQLYDVVYYKGTTYINTSESNLGNIPPDSATWVLVAKRGRGGINFDKIGKEYKEW